MEQIFTDPTSIFYINPGTAVYTLITFGLTFFLLWRFGWKNIVEGIELRNQRIMEQMDHVKQLRRQIVEAKQQQESILEVSRNEAKDAMNEIRSQALHHRSGVIGKAKSTTNEFFQSARRDMEKLKDDAIRESQTEIETLAAELARKIVEQKLRRTLSNEELNASLAAIQQQK